MGSWLSVVEQGRVGKRGGAEQGAGGKGGRVDRVHKRKCTDCR